ncbi:MAG: hypothetical protein ABIO70_21075, partial [Pseudomonadota bacterium]
PVAALAPPEAEESPDGSAPGPAPGARTRAMAREAARDLERDGGPQVDPATWQPGPMTRAFIRRARRPWKRLAVAIVLAGALVGGGLVVRAVILDRATGSGFSLEVANDSPAAVHIACTAGEGEKSRSWGVNVEPGATAAIGIPALPATCEEVLADGSRRLVWTMPKAVSVGQDLPEVTEADERLSPAPPPAPAVEGAAPQAKKPAHKQREVQVARLVVGEAEPPPVDTSACEDLVSLEPQAALGQLSSEAGACLEAVMAGTASLTTKDKVSRLLIWDAEARHDDVAWERLVRRHLATVGSSDPDICMALALRLKKKGTVRALEETIELTNTALENRSRYSGDKYVLRVNSLHALRTVAAETVWRKHEESLPTWRSEEVVQQGEKMRFRTREFAREWLDYAEASGADTTRARAVLGEVG